MSDSDEYPRSAFVKILNGISIFLILVSFLLGILFWRNLPDHVPTNFLCADFFGEPNEWGGRGSVFFIPTFTLIIAGVLSLVSHLRNTNHIFPITEENAERQYALDRKFGALFVMWIAMLFTYIQWMIIQIALGNATSIGICAGVIFLGGAAVMFVIYVVNAYFER